MRLLTQLIGSSLSIFYDIDDESGDAKILWAAEVPSQMKAVLVAHEQDGYHLYLGNSMMNMRIIEDTEEVARALFSEGSANFTEEVRRAIPAKLFAQIVKAEEAAGSRTTRPTSLSGDDIVMRKAG